MVAEVMGVKPVKDGLGHRPGVIGKTEMTIFAEDDVIEQTDPKDVGSLAKPLREHSVFWAGCGITRRMIVSANERGGIHQN